MSSVTVMNGVVFKSPCKGERSLRHRSTLAVGPSKNEEDCRLRSGNALCMLDLLAVPDWIDGVHVGRVNGVCPAAVIRNNGLNEPLSVAKGSLFGCHSRRRRETSNARS